MLFKDFYKQLVTYYDEICCSTSPESYAGSHKTVSHLTGKITNNEYESCEIVGWYEKSYVGKPSEFVFRILTTDNPTNTLVHPTHFANLNEFMKAFNNYVANTMMVIDDKMTVAVESLDDDYDYMFQELDIDTLGGCGCWVGLYLNIERVNNEKTIG